jgi:hypothetical protein
VAPPSSRSVRGQCSLGTGRASELPTGLAPNAAIPAVMRAMKSPRLDMTTSVERRVRMGLAAGVANRHHFSCTGMRKRSPLDHTSLLTIGLVSRSGASAFVGVRIDCATQSDGVARSF